jgi:hypothetical protein
MPIFCVDSREASALVVVRDVKERALLSAWHLLRRCSWVKEAKAKACLEVIQLMVNWVRQPAIVKAECSTIISALRL